MNIIEVKDVYHKYQDGNRTKTVLKNINISFEKGKMYAIVGSSGSGKTTLISLISGLDTVQEGAIEYQGTSIKKIGYTKYRSQYVNIIFQSFNLIKYMSARQNVITAMDIKKVSYKNKRQKAGELLKSLGFDDLMLDQDVLKLSGGEQQRVAIARALVHDSDIILADEPTGNLDKDTRKEILDIFKELTKQGKCVILVTHSESIAKQADIIYKISNGKIKPS